MSYPRTLPDFQRLFPDEGACQAYLFGLRWPKGFLCPICSGRTVYPIDSRRAFTCTTCGRQTYLTAGTMMHRTKLPLQTWFYGVFLITTLTPGISAVQFQQQLGIRSYETAFQMLHKLRSAMWDPERERLVGEVEVDETYVGGVEHGKKRGRSLEGKALVVGAVEVRLTRDERRYAGRLRLRTVASASKSDLETFVQEDVEPGTAILTDGWIGYEDLWESGYDHLVQTKSESQEAGTKYLPLIHREFSNLKTWLQGTHHGRVEGQHLQAYLNEFVFRHNRRFWKFSAFETLLRLGLGRGPQSYDRLYSARGTGHNVHQLGGPET